MVSTIDKFRGGNDTAAHQAYKFIIFLPRLHNYKNERKPESPICKTPPKMSILIFSMASGKQQFSPLRKQEKLYKFGKII